MEEYGHAESTLRNRNYFISLGWEIRNFSIIKRTWGAGQKLQQVSSNKDSSLQMPRENASLSKLQCIIYVVTATCLSYEYSRYIF